MSQGVLLVPTKELSRQPKYEPSGAKDLQREQGIAHSQSRVFQNDSKYSKSELQGTSDSKKLTQTSQKRNLSHVQSTCSSKTPRTQLPSVRSAAEAKPTNS